MNDKKFIIYKVTNKVNGKIYIGITSRPLKHRREIHYRDAKYKHYKFQNAINKYKEDDFVWEVIDKALSFENACAKEVYYISFYDSYHNGYNSTRGGDNVPINLGKDNVKSKYVYQFDIDGNLVKIHESGRQASLEIGVHEGSVGVACRNKNTVNGYIWLYEKDLNQLVKLVQKQQYIQGKTIAQYTKENKIIREFPSIKQAALDLGVHEDTIGKALRGINKTGAGYIWKYVKG